MDSSNLKTASTYVNNLLLARGLLRNGKPIEFAHPSRGEGGKEATMAQIINLVHDLILRRDVCFFSSVQRLSTRRVCPSTDIFRHDILANNTPVYRRNKSHKSPSPSPCAPFAPNLSAAPLLLRSIPPAPPSWSGSFRSHSRRNDPRERHSARSRRQTARCVRSQSALKLACDKCALVAPTMCASAMYRSSG